MKIHIIGCSGSGKTYLSTHLSRKYNIPQFDLDDIYWDNKSNKYGTKRKVDERNSLLSQILENENWIIEGVYYSWLENSFENADIIYVLNMPEYLYKWRIIIRFVKRKLGIECGKKETLKSVIKLLKWTNTFQNVNMKEISSMLMKYKDKTVWLSSKKSVCELLNNKNRHSF